MFSHLLGVAGFAAATDYFYFVMNGFISCADKFVSAIVGLPLWRNTSSLLGYNFKSAVNNRHPPRLYICLVPLASSPP
jgi:hypothetical protein